MRIYRVSAPLSATLPGPAAGVIGVSLDREQVRVTVKYMGQDGVRVDVKCRDKIAQKASYYAANLLLEELGEEAVLDIEVELTEPVISRTASTSAATISAITSLLGIEIGVEELAKIANRAVAIATGRPRPPTTAAALLGGVAVGVDNPPYFAKIDSPTPPWRIYLVDLCNKLGEPPPILIDVNKSLHQGWLLAVLLAEITRQNWPIKLSKILRYESPWDYAAPEGIKRARKAAIDAGAISAGVDPYNRVLVVLSSEKNPAEIARNIISSIYECQPFLVEGNPTQRGALVVERE